MSVSDTDFKHIYVGRGDTGPYAIDFDVNLDDSGNAQDIVVKLLTAAGVETDITGTSTVTGLNVYTALSYDSTYKVTVARYPDLTQPYVFAYKADLPAKTIEEALDRQTYLAQRNALDMELALKAPISDAPMARIPSKAIRALQGLLFDANGDPIAGGFASSPINTAWQAYLASPSVINAAWQAALAQGVIPTIQKAFNGGVESYTPMAGYTPAAGDVVELLNDGTIRKALRSAGTAFTLNTASVIKLAPVDATHFLAVYRFSATEIKAVIGTVDPITLAVTGFGTAVSVASGLTAVSAITFDVAAYSSTLALCAYTANTAASQLKVVVLSISGTTITVNTPVNGTATATQVSLGLFDVTHVTMAWANSTTTVQATVVSVSGTTPTIGAVNTLTAPNAFDRTEVLVHASEPITGSGGRVILLAVLDLTTVKRQVMAFHAITSGTDGGQGQTPGWWSSVDTSHAIIGPLGYANVFSLFSPDAARTFTSKGVLGFTVDVSLVPSGFSMKWLYTVKADASFAVNPIDPANGVFLVSYYANNPFGNSPSGFQIGAFLIRRRSMSTEFEVGDLVHEESSFGGKAIGNATALSSGIILVPWGDPAQPSVKIRAMRRQNGIIGVAVDAAGTVQRTGSFATSGLVAGSRYYADDSGALTTTPSGVEIGIASSTTQLSLAVKGGV